MAHGPAIWLPFIQPFGTVVLGVGAAAIALRQWITAHDKLRLELFDKRVANFNSLMHFFDTYRTGGGLELQSIKSLDTLILGASLLFGDDMNNLIVAARQCIKTMPQRHSDPANSVTFNKLSREVDNLQFKMRDVLKKYAGMSRVR